MKFKKLVAILIIISTLLASTGIIFADDTNPIVWSHKITINK